MDLGRDLTFQAKVKHASLLDGIVHGFGTAGSSGG